VYFVYFVVQAFGCGYAAPCIFWLYLWPLRIAHPCVTVTAKVSSQRMIATSWRILMAREFLLVLLGLAAGMLSGLIGIGGGIIIIPALVLLFGLTQHQAQGTTLALLIPPIGILAAWTYYKQGFVDVRIALFIAIGFVAGSYFGARVATRFSDATLERVFGFALLLIALKMIVGK
jgi:uncharacterized membrane protein YfcA